MAETKFCCTCMKRQPVTQFRSGNSRECNECVRKGTRQRKVDDDDVTIIRIPREGNVPLEVTDPAAEIARLMNELANTRRDFMTVNSRLGNANAELAAIHAHLGHANIPNTVQATRLAADEVETKAFTSASGATFQVPTGLVEQVRCLLFDSKHIALGKVMNRGEALQATLPPFNPSGSGPRTNIIVLSRASSHYEGMNNIQTEAELRKGAIRIRDRAATYFRNLNLAGLYTSERVRRSSDGIICFPVGHSAPSEVQLFWTLDGMVRRGEQAIFVVRSYDGLSNPTSTKIFLAY